jgi:hypothetical protein
MPVFQLGGKDVHVEAWKTSWPASIFYKRQGVEVKIDPSSHWWCLWLCDSTDSVDRISCTAELRAVLEGDATVEGTCSSCGDLTVKSGASWGVSAPWLYQRADFQGTVVVDGATYAFKGDVLYT